MSDQEELTAAWRIKAEEWEAKYRDAVENEGKRWEHAIDTWRKRYEDALRRRARHLQDELNKEIARRAHLEREIARLHAEIAGRLKSQPTAQPTTDNRS
jgi:predicted  nucleic acid-binding Zn-ribbon protein